MEQAAGLAQQLASLAADKSGLDEAQATLSGQLTQLQVRGVVAVQWRAWWSGPLHADTTDRLLCSSPSAMPFAFASSACRRSWPSCGPTRRRMPPSLSAACRCAAEGVARHRGKWLRRPWKCADATGRCRLGAHVGSKHLLLPFLNVSRRRWTLRRSGSSLRSSCRPSRASCRRRWRERRRSCRWVDGGEDGEGANGGRNADCRLHCCSGEAAQHLHTCRKVQPLRESRCGCSLTHPALLLCLPHRPCRRSSRAWRWRRRHATTWTCAPHR